MPLKNVLISIENEHHVSFNYLDSDVENITITKPPKNYTLEKKIIYLTQKTNLVFEKITQNIYTIQGIYNLWINPL